MCCGIFLGATIPNPPFEPREHGVLLRLDTLKLLMQAMSRRHDKIVTIRCPKCDTVHNVIDPPLEFRKQCECGEYLVHEFGKTRLVIPLPGFIAFDPNHPS
jgi:hypothetical protein